MRTICPRSYNYINFPARKSQPGSLTLTLTARYDASAIEVLTGLDPVRKRPGMYTQTETPNHLAHEVIDNSVDEVIAGFASKIEVTRHIDESLSVVDNGRGNSSRYPQRRKRSRGRSHHDTTPFRC